MMTGSSEELQQLGRSNDATWDMGRVLSTGLHEKIMMKRQTWKRDVQYVVGFALMIYCTSIAMKAVITYLMAVK